jgi:RimJ/RimL family protein N-acetyltransferase
MNIIPATSPERLAEAAANALFPDLTRDDVFRIETPRLWLRWMRHADAPALADIAGRREVAEMTGTFPHPLPAGEAERRVFEARKANATGTALVLAMAPKHRPAAMVGSIGLSLTFTGASQGAPGLGFMLHPQAWGQGYATEAVQAMLDTVFTYTAAQDVAASVRVINPASRRVLEKCGFRQTGTGLIDLPARGGMLPCDSFVLDRKAWAALKSWGRTPSPVARAAPDEPADDNGPALFCGQGVALAGA